MAKKERLDKILVEKGFFETKNKAQAAILAGDVKLNGETVTKAAHPVEWCEDTKIEITSMPFVSRGGLKLHKAVESFGLDLSGKICLDAGASTGGFTDCMLQRGAKKVYAVDVGYGQIAWKLRNDPRVKVVERTNIKNCLPSDIYNTDDVLPAFCAMDLSFISITKVLANITDLMSDEGKEIVALIKPQFEAGKELVGKNGVVRDKSTHIKVINDVINFAEQINLYPQKLDFSPIKGPAGNIEYLILLASNAAEFDRNCVFEIVDAAHNCEF